MHAACQRRAAHVVSVKSTKMGSLNECRRVFEICQAHGVRVHIGGSAGPAVVDVAMAQLAASLSGMDNECEVGEFGLGVETLAPKDRPILVVRKSVRPR